MIEQVALTKTARAVRRLERRTKLNELKQLMLRFKKADGYRRHGGHQLWICKFRHPRGSRVSQNLCKWVLKLLTDEHKRTRVETCRQFLQLNNEGEGGFLQWIITGDAIWLQANVKARDGNTRHRQGPSNSKCPFCRRSNDDTVLVL